MNIVADKVLSDVHAIIKPALKYQFEGCKHLLTKGDWQEINFMALFLTVSIFVDAARISRMPDEDTNELIKKFMDAEVDHLDDAILLNERIHEYSPLFKPLSPTPFAALSSSFLDNLTIEDDSGMMHFMGWFNGLYLSTLESMVTELTSSKQKPNTIKIGGSGCLTLIAASLGLCALLWLL